MLQGTSSLPQASCGIEPEAIRQLLHAINSAHESQIPFQSSILSCVNDVNPYNSNHSAANLYGLNPEESTLHVQHDSSEQRDKSENGKVHDSSKLHDFSSSKSFDSFQTGATLFEVTTPLIQERTNLHLQQLGDYPHCCTSPISESRSFKSGVVTNKPSSTQLCGEKIIPVLITQQLAQHIVPCLLKSSIMEEKSDELAVMGSLDIPQVAKPDQPSDYSPEMNVQRPRKRVVSGPLREGKVLLRSVSLCSSYCLSSISIIHFLMGLFPRVLGSR